MEEKIKKLFENWNETIIWSCLQGIMGEIHVNSKEDAAMAKLGDFAFFAGNPSEELVRWKTENCKQDFIIMVPQNDSWAELIQMCYGDQAKRVTRYAMKKEKDIFDKAKLEQAVLEVPAGYELKMIEEAQYFMCRSNGWAYDLVSQFRDYAAYEKLGLGVVALKDGELAAGASSYSRYHEGIEIEIDTREDHRRKGLAYVCGAKLILECQKRGLYPSWDAQNKWSVALAEKLGYHFSHEYTAYEIIGYNVLKLDVSAAGSYLPFYKLFLFDLDGTLLRSDKTISKVTMRELLKCRKQGIMIGVSTSRSEKNSMAFIAELNPDVVISSAGALVKYKEEYIYKAEFTKAETKELIHKAREICGEDCEITIDTIEAHYWNYKIDPKRQDKSWGDSIYTDFHDFEQESLKMCVEILDENTAKKLQHNLPDCDCVRFSDGYWYKFSKKTATKENAILHMCEKCGITTDEIAAFGDDYADIGMLKLCGMGVAMGNAIDEVKAVADYVIGDNDNDGIGRFLQKFHD